MDRFYSTVNKGLAAHYEQFMPQTVMGTLLMEVLRLVERDANTGKEFDLCLELLTYNWSHYKETLSKEATKDMDRYLKVDILQTLVRQLQTLGQGSVWTTPLREVHKSMAEWDLLQRGHTIAEDDLWGALKKAHLW